MDTFNFPVIRIAWTDTEQENCRDWYASIYYPYEDNQKKAKWHAYTLHRKQDFSSNTVTYDSSHNFTKLNTEVKKITFPIDHTTYDQITYLAINDLYLLRHYKQLIPPEHFKDSWSCIDQNLKRIKNY
ncbi:MAG: hypothetical protein CMO81_11485 [Waddliaceae bacterium]|nr:hypothetical protein [Waddliaceae bacterium]